MRSLVFGLALLLLAPSSPACAAIWELPLGPYGTLRLDVPDGWTAKLQGRETPNAGTITIDPPQGIPLILLITPFPLPDNAADSILEDGSRSVTAFLQKVAEEPVLEVKRFEAGLCRGFYVAATDKTVAQPSPQKYKYAIQGHLVSAKAFATFSILTNLAGGPERERALEIVRSAWHEPGASTMPVPDKTGTVSLSFPDRNWRLLLDLPGFVFEPVQALPQQRGMQLAANNPTTGVNLTAFLDSSAAGLTSVDLRERYWERIQSSGPFVDVRRSERDGMALLERTFTGPAGLRLDQRHLNAHIAHDNVWIDVHLSKVKYTPQDDALFDAIVKTIRTSKKGIADFDYNQAVLRLTPGKPLDYFGRASVHFRNADYAKAIADFNEVVRREPDFAGAYKGRSLSHRRTGEPDRAIADYGEVIRLEPNQTLGYYGRGSVYQERGEIDRAIADFDQVIRLDPKHSLAFEQRGRAHENKGQRDSAIADYRQVIALQAPAPVQQRARDGLKRLGVP